MADDVVQFSFPPDIELGEFLRRCRENRSMTQADVNMHAIKEQGQTVDGSRLSKIETGERHSIRGNLPVVLSRVYFPKNIEQQRAFLDVVSALLGQRPKEFLDSTAIRLAAREWYRL